MKKKNFTIKIFIARILCFILKRHEKSIKQKGTAIKVVSFNSPTSEVDFYRCKKCKKIIAIQRSKKELI